MRPSTSANRSSPLWRCTVVSRWLRKPSAAHALDWKTHFLASTSTGGSCMKSPHATSCTPPYGPGEPPWTSAPSRVQVRRAHLAHDRPRLVEQLAVEHADLVDDQRLQLAQAEHAPLVLLQDLVHVERRPLDGEPDAERRVEGGRADDRGGAARRRRERVLAPDALEPLPDQPKRVALAHAGAAREEDVVPTHRIEEGVRLLGVEHQLLLEHALRHAAHLLAEPRVALRAPHGHPVPGSRRAARPR